MSLLAVFIYRPNIRMVDRFGYGRVYIAGGMFRFFSFVGLMSCNWTSKCIITEEIHPTCSAEKFPFPYPIDAAHVHSPTGGQVCLNLFLTFLLGFLIHSFASFDHSHGRGKNRA